ncbi:organomercurial lyase [Spirillospora sp. NPDC048911]|uniref:organomercurial lyase n=1 Tax=Spirillospora sp. NPDC048911 TaxID=3364527 RepID=UPI00371477C1
MTIDNEDLRLAVYRWFAETGQAPQVAELADRFGVDTGVVRGGLRALAGQRHVVLDDQDRVLMAHPFASIPLGFAVMGTSTLWWGGCAWDSFALAHLLPDEPDVLVSTRCPGCDRPHAWVVGRDAPPGGDQVAHFLVPVARMWDDVVHTCGHQRLFCGESCVDDWLERSGNERGYVMDLATLWRLASGWYAGRLDRGYTRREPATAAAYLREAGLRGPFWGLPSG